MTPVFLMFSAFIAVIILSVFITRFYFTQKSLEQKEKRESTVLIKKHSEINPENYRPVFLRYGMILSLILSIFIISWATYERKIEKVGVALAIDEFDIETPRTKPEPPPPPPPEPPIIKVIDDDKPSEDEVEFDIDINIDDEFGFDEGFDEVQDEKIEEIDIYLQVEEMPQFPGGDVELLKFLGGIKYPDIARENDIQGKVFVLFIIDKTGKPTNIHVVKGASRVLNEAAIAHVKKMPRWTPGKQRGKPVNVQFVVPIKFVMK